jgi:hypothetical protein
VVNLISTASGTRRAAALLIVALAVIALTACSSSSGEDVEQPTDTSTGGPTPVVETSTAQIALASTDLSVGPNHLSFGLIDLQSGPIRDADVLISTFFLGGGQQEGPIQTARALWRNWPVGQAGVYTANFDFPQSGDWGIVASFVDSSGASRTASAGLDVKALSSTPAIGGMPPKSVTKLASDFDDLQQMTSDPEPDPDLYAMTVADALQTGKPLLVTFSTPAFCQSATCGPQLDVVKELKTTHGDRVNFIHVEVYDNPNEIKGDLSNARLVQAIIDWGLPTEPWTFVIDAEGKVAAKFENFITKDELEQALTAVLQ